MTPVALAAQDEVQAEEETGDSPTDVQVTLSGYTFAPELDENGEPVLDDEGEPVILRVPLAESVVTPGDLVLYVVTLGNPTDEPAIDLMLSAQVAAEVLLDPFSFTGPDGLEITWTDTEAPEDFRPVFEVIDGEEVMTADLDTLRVLRLSLPELTAAEQVSIEYIVTLR